MAKIWAVSIKMVTGISSTKVPVLKLQGISLFSQGNLLKKNCLQVIKIVDHIDGDKDNNHPANLRVCSQRDNTSNMACHRRGRLVGTSFVTRLGKWKGYIYINNKQVYLGLYDTMEAAHEAYLKAKEELL